MLSIVTATWNRAHTLPKLYESLLDNFKECKEIEWVIMDDGSTDHTKDLIATYQKVSPFSITYRYQKNSGKMAALNAIMKDVKGDHLIEIDSDDYLLPHAVIEIESDWLKRKQFPNTYGILYLRRMKESDPTTFPNPSIPHKMFDLYMKEGFLGETTIVFDSTIRKKYHHRLEENECFVTEARMYHEMDLSYEGLLCISKEVIGGEYLEDGYSNDPFTLFLKYPHGYFAYFKESLTYPADKILFSKRLYLIKHYILFGELLKKTKQELVSPLTSKNRFFVSLAYLPGRFKTRKKLKEQQK